MLDSKELPPPTPEERALERILLDDPPHLREYPGGAYGANRSATGAFGGIAGDQGLPGAASPLALNFDQDAANRYAAARQATLDRKQTFRTGTVGQVLKPGQGGASYGVADADVARRFLNGQPTEPARVQEFIQAAGGGDQASGAHARGVGVGPSTEGDCPGRWDDKAGCV